MVGRVIWTARRSGREEPVRAGALLQARVWEASILRGRRTPELLVRRRCAAAAARLGRLGVTCCVFPEGFGDTGVFARAGIAPADPLPLYQSLAPELVRTVMAERGLDRRGTVVAVCADRLTAQVRQAVTALCLQNRYVLLDAPDRDGAFCRRLRREFGVPLARTEGPGRSAQLSRAAVAVLFAPRETAPSQAALALYPGAALPPYALALPEELEAQLPRDACRMQLLGALWLSGAIRPGQVTVLPATELPADGSA